MTSIFIKWQKEKDNGKLRRIATLLCCNSLDKTKEKEKKEMKKEVTIRRWKVQRRRVRWSAGPRACK